MALLFVVASGTTVPAMPANLMVKREYRAEEADQGVASDGDYFYAIDNNRIGKYRISDGEKIAVWEGDPERFPHINSCTVVSRELVCAASNYPAVPQQSSVEFFSLEPLAHLRSVALTDTPGSLTVMDRHDGRWWAVFANYDERGSPPEKGHRETYLVSYDNAFRAEKLWTFPDAVLDRFTPSSCSGASWTKDNRLLVSGHDRPEIYVLGLPGSGSVLRHISTVGIASHGQAIDVDPAQPDQLWSIDRATKTVFASMIAPPDF